MKITLCTEDKVFPYLMIDNFYSKDEEKLIWEELTFHKNNFKVDHKVGTEGGARDKNNKPLANATRLYLDDIYRNNRQDSNILSLYPAISISTSVGITFIH